MEKGRLSNDYLDRMTPWNKQIFIILSLEALRYIPGRFPLVSQWRCLVIDEVPCKNPEPFWAELSHFFRLFQFNKKKGKKFKPNLLGAGKLNNDVKFG